MSPTPPPYTPNEAKNLAKRAVLDGRLVYAQPHALQEMQNDQLIEADVENTLRAGFANEPEWERGAWRYRIQTNRIAVIIQFLADGRVFVVTVFRLGRGR